MFQNLDVAPPDAILGLTDAFRKDSNPNKINLSVGVYKDEKNRTPVLQSVLEAERRLLESESSKSYAPIEGTAEYGTAVRGLLFGEAHELVSNGRAVTAHTPGGTGALRVAADLLKRKNPTGRVWLSDPTWANHQAIFAAAGIETATYPYYDAEAKGLAFERMLDALGNVPAGDVVLMHACCHNPSGMDPEPGQWKAIADVAQEKEWLPLFDFAYQGFGSGIDEDAEGVREFLRPGMELLIASSFSKNFGLYNERTGALTLVADDPKHAEAALSHIRICIRTNYSNPPAHGGAIVTTILNDAELRSHWEQEVAAMRSRINGMREMFVQALNARGVKRDFSFLTRQKGMFSFAGITKDQVERLRNNYAIYIVGSGRVNVAGMTPGNTDRLGDAFAEVLGE